MTMGLRPVQIERSFFVWKFLASNNVSFEFYYPMGFTEVPHSATRAKYFLVLLLAKCEFGQIVTFDPSSIKHRSFLYSLFSLLGESD